MEPHEPPMIGQPVPRDVPFVGDGRYSPNLSPDRDPRRLRGLRRERFGWPGPAAHPGELRKNPDLV